MEALKTLEDGSLIRRYRESDLETLCQITIVCFEGVSVDKNIEDRFGIIAGVDWKERKRAHIDHDASRNPDGIFVAEVNGQIAGYVTTDFNRKTKIGDITNLAVSPEFQRRGLGRLLLETALTYLQQAGMLQARIATLAQNQIGADFYPRMGFVEVARQIHFIRPLS